MPGLLTNLLIFSRFSTKAGYSGGCFFDGERCENKNDMTARMLILLLTLLWKWLTTPKI